MKFCFMQQYFDQCRLLYGCDVHYISSREFQRHKRLKKFTRCENLQFDCRLSLDVRDVWDMEDVMEDVKNAKAEFIDKFQGEKF